MENELQQKFLVKLEDLIVTVRKDDLYKTYISLLDKMKKHPLIFTLVQEVKMLQKSAVKAEVMGDLTEISRLDVEIDSIIKYLDGYPLYLDFLEVQRELDEVFQLIKDEIQNMLFS